MPSHIFDRAIAAAGAAADCVMADAFALTPMMRAADNAPDAADSSRAASYSVEAHFLDPEARPQMADAYDPRQFRRPGTESGSPYLKISAHEMARQKCADARFAVKAADVFVRQKDQTRWRASAPFLMAGGAMRVTVNLIG
jgi:hypothetical protein